MNHKDVFIFAQNGIDIKVEIEKANVICMVDDPSQAFAEYLKIVYGEHEKANRLKKYTHTINGYVCGENVHIGENTYIEPSVFIDHGVEIGDNCIIKYGAVLRNCIIGNECTIYEGAIVGNEPYYLHTENDKHVHSIAVGKAILKDGVDVGAHSIVDRGTLTDTILHENVKLDTYVHVGHDAIIKTGVLVTSTSIVGGFCEVGENSEICSATIMKRTKIGSNSFVGLNSGVISDVGDGVEVFGYPERMLKKVSK